MHRRILFGVAAWLLGAATATAGSLLAVSLLGQGITGTSGPLLSQIAVNRALGTEPDQPAASAHTSPAGAGVRVRTPSPQTPTPMPTTVTSSPTPSSAPDSAPADATAQAGGTVLTSRGGDVVASCPAGGAYLDAWSPAQGYLADSVLRGPAQTARVSFDPAAGSDGAEVTMVVSCSAGTPSAATYSGEPGDE